MLSAACDDGRVRKLGGGFTVYSCVCYRDATPLDAHLGIVRIDGLEASGLLAYSVLRACRGPPDLVLLDSVTIAGFNVASPYALHRLVGAPVVVVYTYRPSYERLAPAAMRAPGGLGPRRPVLRLVNEAVEVETRRGPLHILAVGTSLAEAVEAIESLQVHSRVPEPLRMAHALASEASRLLMAPSV